MQDWGLKLGTKREGEAGFGVINWQKKAKESLSEEEVFNGKLWGAEEWFEERSPGSLAKSLFKVIIYLFYLMVNLINFSIML